MPKNMKYAYCTVFDRGFLNRGLALYNSVLKHHKKDFLHFILCLDNTTYEILRKLELKHTRLVKLSDFENKKLLEIKQNRSFREYCWSLSSIFTKYVLDNNPNIEIVSYLDADLYFFDSPEKIVDKFSATEDSILIIPHNLPAENKSKEEAVGKYNVGMVVFKNDRRGRSCLDWWASKCEEWCYDRVEPTRYGDQKYLDYFEEKFGGVYIENSAGACLAPWNIANFKNKIRLENGTIYIDKDPLIFFHFSSFNIYFPRSRFLPNGSLTSRFVYVWPTIEKKLIYRHYFEALYEAMEIIRKIDPSFIYGVTQRPNFYKQIIEIIGAVTLRGLRKAVLAVLPNKLISFISKAKIKIFKR